MATFQRARSDEQRAVRRRSILETAAGMLDEMPVAAVSLNELSRRVGLAKSAMTRYFESREAVLLDLLSEAAARYRADVAGTLPGWADPSAPAPVRARQVAARLATTFAAHPMLCELLSAQHAILEHNVSVEVAARYKRSSRDAIHWLAERLRDLLPELDAERALRAAHMVIILVGALWTRSRPAPAQLAAFRADSSLAFMHPAFAEAFEAAIATFFRGLVAETADAA
ncbi:MULTISPECIES: TetR/AcrR family transcriptional regulator [Streptomyces]|uniref:TetR family transcriptional regulator n=1 Tax=Streptomyces liliiviolaceus TaxID=2823109 RepID=A0A941B8Q0_9ACTN|nr:TetR/AcrR family transcriptional regulator [Streptomyces liliiviolaceus]MBQ0854845.1 TetR family transcriptional regulator [Streptomyces liliiviolaceus]